MSIVDGAGAGSVPGVTVGFVLRGGAGSGGGGSRLNLHGGGGGVGVVAVVGRGHALLPVYLKVLPERGRMGVGFITSPDITVVRFVGCMNVHVLLSITGVGEPAVTSLDLALKRFLA